MKIIMIPVLIFVLSISASHALAQEEANGETKQKIPEGMEEIQIGGSAKLIIPKGAKVTKVGAQLIVEGTKEYMARKVSEMEERLAAIEKNQEDLKNEIQTLAEFVNKNLKNEIEALAVVVNKDLKAEISALTEVVKGIQKSTKANRQTK